MPRRRRPPSTTREIGAYLCGARLCREYYAQPGEARTKWHPTHLTLVKRLAYEDAEIMASMDEDEWWDHFWAGWGSVAP